MPFNAVFSHIIKKRLPRIRNYSQNPIDCQKIVLKQLLEKSLNTSFGVEHCFDEIQSHEEFKNQVPLSNYDQLQPFINRQIAGEENVLWPGKTSWFAKSSGTSTKNAKLLPITVDSLYENHYAGGKDLLAIYYENHSNRKLYNAKHLVIGGSTQINTLTNDTSVGDLSAFIVENLPWWTEIRRTPNRKIALMDNWEKKLDQMAHATINDNICIVAGLPSWTLVLFQRVLDITGKANVHEVWPNLELYIHGGMNIAPYQLTFDKMLPKSEMNYVQSYNSSEGYFGLQDKKNATDMLLLTDAQIYYEFIPMNEFKELESNTTLDLKEVEIDKEYALVISTSAGLWRYIIGDTIRFTSTKPFRFLVTGRTTHYINAFGEKTIISHVESALSLAAIDNNVDVIDFTVAPYFEESKGSGGHQWLLAIENPKDLDTIRFENDIEENMKALNGDYLGKRKQSINMLAPKFDYVNKQVFETWLKHNNKLGGQHKIPRIQNDRKLIEELLEIYREVT
ncbi:MAG: GH3 auxin-responsive promoter family protein [Crocinitomicaceae bacterium]|tara:strand:+ start:2419 stop:3942 length:1524 start_codon:yes stop_codon:yes gene_type:complete